MQEVCGQGAGRPWFWTSHLPLMLVLFDARAVAKLVRRLDPDFLLGFRWIKHSL